jgi:hypothetical protein
MAAGALGQGIVDVQNDPPSTTGFGCGADVILNGTILQGFIPHEDTLIAVELRLQAGTTFPAEGFTTTARLRAGTPAGAVLAEATAQVAGPMAAGAQALVRFDFPTLSLTPLDTYVIEWVTPSTSILTWVGKTASADGYTDGTMYSCSGSVWPVPNTDLNFITYAEEEVVEVPTGGDEPLPCDPTALLGQLHDIVDGLGLRPHLYRKLDCKLDKAGRYIERDKTRAACGQLNAFSKHVRFLDRFGIIDDAQTLLDLSAALQECLGGCAKWCSKEWSHERGHGKHHDHDGEGH